METQGHMAGGLEAPEGVQAAPFTAAWGSHVGVHLEKPVHKRKGGEGS